MKSAENKTIPRKDGRQPFGFPDLTDYINRYVGEIQFHCEYCGMYEASEPRCNKCEKDK